MCHEQCHSMRLHIWTKPVPVNMFPMPQGGIRGIPSAADSLPMSISTSGRATSAGDTSSSSEVGCLQLTSDQLLQLVRGPRCPQQSRCKVVLMAARWPQGGAHGLQNITLMARAPAVDRTGSHVSTCNSRFGRAAGHH
jgi:hypothetical protein